MGRRLMVINALLSFVALGLLGALGWIILAPVTLEHPPTRPLVEQEFRPSVRRAGPKEAPSYEVIVEQDIFAKPTVPVRPVVPQKAVTPPPPPPPPLPKLLGTIIEEGKGRAILQVGTGRPEFYELGEGVAGGVVAGIFEDRVLFQRDQTISEILMPKTIEAAPSPLPAAKAPRSSPTVQKAVPPLLEEEEEEEEADLPPPSTPQAVSSGGDLGLVVVPVLAGGKVAKIVVNSVRFFSPAMAAGLQKGDVITKINGREVTAMTMNEVDTLLHGGTGSVALAVQRGNQNLEFQVETP
ncbi:MAG: PDZ domain-containing protein [candidate division NC10 bacterium]|nr:PDZ domain-containing protein [candidate division NC10 bacterium]